MKVAIASGKGGTGKTTVAVNLALAAGPVQLLDCDVEDPDAAIFLHPEVSSVAPVMVRVPRVLPASCTYCKACAEFCEYNALVVLADQWLVTPELCKDCGGCYLVCPEEALVPETRRIGQIERGTVHASQTAGVKHQGGDGHHRTVEEVPVGKQAGLQLANLDQVHCAGDGDRNHHTQP